MSKRMYVYVGGIVAVCLMAACAIFLWMSNRPVAPKAGDLADVGQEILVADTSEEITESQKEEKSTFVAPAEYEAVITVTINPTIRIYVGKDGEVLAVEPVNADAKAVVAVMNEVTLESMDLDACMDLLMTTACELNYLADGEGIEVAVAAKSEEVTKKMMEEVKECVEETAKALEIAVALEVKESNAEVQVAKNPEKEEKPAKKLVAPEVKPIATKAPQATKEPVKEENSSKPGKEDNKASKPQVKNEYKLVWEDNFNGTELNREDWNVELHAPGWVNAEWQEYVDSTDNIYVKDGKLVIQAIKTGEDDNAYYTSGRVNTQGKHDFKYGKFEAKIKVPSGMGFLPAFWMMPTDENFYGQWPKCGEIDIMEVMGQSTDTLHGTIHFGEPHTQKQGTYVAESADFAEDFHVFACEWEPGEIRWYVDGNLYYKTSDWFTQKPGFDEVAYPAPFDQPFYMILNLAVGGSWVGYPDETTQFGDNAQLVVDYVKVYQKDKYNENVTKPEQAPIVFREPDETGNYVVNGDFATAEDLTDGKNWGFMLAQGGEATATISNGALHIETTKAGTVDYSVQVVQPDMSMMLGKRYRLSFDAYADADRTMITGVTAPDYNYVRYLADTKLNLTTTKQSYAYEFDMTVRDDANGRVEFNLGNQGSTATVHISNVRLEVIGDCEVPADEKSVLPDGNYVYNGEFSYGADRMDYWTVPSTNAKGSKVSVTNSNGVRELMVTVPGGVNDLSKVVVEQKDVALTVGTKYVLSFDAHADKTKEFKATIAGSEFICAVGTQTKEYTYSFVAGEGNVLAFLLGTAGTTYIDNVRIQEDGMLVNGGFSNGLVGYETYYDASANASFSVDELNEGGAACIDIKDTGDADWKIQLKQNNVTLEEAKWYRISFKAKSVTALGSGGSAFNRDIMCALQRNGAVHKTESGGEDWTPYVQKTVSLTGEYQNFAFDFQMMPATAPKTDEGTILTFSMGAVGGTRITDSHIVVIDDVVLEEIEAPVQEGIPVGTELITNGSFAENAKDWAIDICGDGAATTSVTEGAITFDITNPGSADWNVKLHQDGKRLEQGASYEVKFTITSSVDRIVKWGLMTGTYNWYTGEDMSLTAGETHVVEHTYTVGADKPTTDDINFYISMGKNDGEETPAGQITVTAVSVKKVAVGEVTPPSGEDTGNTEGGEGNEGDEGTSTVEPLPAGTELIKNGNFANDGENWVAGINSPAVATVTYADEKATLAIENAGEANWHLQLFQNDVALEAGASYKVTFTIQSDVNRSAKYAILDPSNGYKWYGGEAFELEAGVAKEISYVTGPTEVATVTGQFQMTFAPDGDSTNVPTDAHTIEISNVSIVKQ